MKKLILVALLTMVGVLACGKDVLRGPKGDTGAAGANGSNGSDGSSGAAGSVGAVGPQGSPGVDATPVTVVQVCPNPTTYGTTYSEVLFCVGGKLYGTYSTNGGFSSEIVPGAYSSNGINSSCTFIVEPNCVVHQ